VYNYFTHTFNNVLSRQLKNVTTHVFSYSLIDVGTHHNIIV